MEFKNEIYEYCKDYVRLYEYYLTSLDLNIQVDKEKITQLLDNLEEDIIGMNELNKQIKSEDL